MGHYSRCVDCGVENFALRGGRCQRCDERHVAAQAEEFDRWWRRRVSEQVPRQGEEGR